MRFKINHPLAKEAPLFKSWMKLCEYVLDLAMEEAQLRMGNEMLALASEIADEIIEDVEEIES